ncbi:MAG TPA: YkgJ family cysteine cluster protein [Polyangiaceae bacterium]|nr:YkgJ family cysteine cluster protein [Polyangiaceae bacterium]
MGIDRRLLSFHCTGCGNCCRDPLLPITDCDLRRLMDYTGRSACELVRWVTAQQIDLDDEPEAFVLLRMGKRVMTLRHRNGGCMLLGPDQRCTVYTARPLGCRVFPFDTKFDRTGKLRRLELIQATECVYERTGKQSIPKLRSQQLEFLDEVDAFQAKTAGFNQLQRQRARSRRSLLTASDFFRFLGIG